LLKQLLLIVQLSLGYFLFVRLSSNRNNPRGTLLCTSKQCYNCWSALFCLWCFGACPRCSYSFNLPIQRCRGKGPHL